MKHKTLLITLAVLLIGTFVYTWAAPVGPTAITEGTSERANIGTAGVQVNATAGNVTELNISARAITESWQGYFGAISASIILADASNNQFYNWSVTSPSGEVYASPNSSVNWTAIYCFNYTSPYLNLTVEQNWYNIAASAADGINETFNETTHGTFDVGTVTIPANTCPSTFVYNSTGYQTDHYSNVLLSDNSSLVFTGIVDNDEVGFDTGTYDFQLLVAEDGHGAAAATTTTYYFWVEIS